MFVVSCYSDNTGSVQGNVDHASNVFGRAVAHVTSASEPTHVDTIGGYYVYKTDAAVQCYKIVGLVVLSCGIMLPIVPVIVNDKIKTYTLLDSARMHSFVKNNLLNELSLLGATK